MIVTLVILVITAVLFVSGRFRTDLVAVSALVLLVLFGVLTASEALSGFSNSVVIMMIGLFVVGGGIFRTGLAKMISGKILKFAGKSELRLLVTIMVVTVGLGSFVSNTGTVAVMLPIVVSLAMSANMNPARLLMPLAFASSISGLMTLIGTPPNLIISDALEGAGYGKLGFFTVTPIGLIALVTGIVLLVPLSKLLVRDADGESAKGAGAAPGRSPSQLANRYRIASNLYRVRADAASLILEKPMSELNITGRYQVSILEIRRRTSARNPFFKTVEQQMVNSSSVVHEGDILYVLGRFEQVERFARECGLILMDKQDTEKLDEGALRNMMFQYAPWRIASLEGVLDAIFHEGLDREPRYLHMLRAVVSEDLPLQIIFMMRLNEGQVMSDVRQLIGQTDMVMRRGHDIPQVLRQVLAHARHRLDLPLLGSDADQIQHIMDEMRCDLRLQSRVPRLRFLQHRLLLPLDRLLQPLQQFLERLVQQDQFVMLRLVVHLYVQIAVLDAGDLFAQVADGQEEIFRSQIDINEQDQQQHGDDQQRYREHRFHRTKNGFTRRQDVRDPASLGGSDIRHIIAGVIEIHAA